MRRLFAIPALCLALAAPVHAKDEAGKPSDDELRRAREELVRARDDLRRAAEELARMTMAADKDSPRARAWEYMANPRRAMLGVMIADGPEKEGQIRGVLVTGITPGSGADKAGLKSGDLLVTANGQPLATKAAEKGGPEHRLRDIMGALKPGDLVKLSYEREGKRYDTTVTASRQESSYGPMLGWNDEGDFDVVVPPVPPMPPIPAIPAMRMRMHDGGPDIGGMQLAKLDSQLAPYFRTDKGVLVVAAPRSGSLGLKGGDVIQKVDGKAVASPVEVWERFGDLDDEDKVKVDVVRQGKAMNLEGTLPDHRRMVRRIEIHGPDEDDEHDEDEDEDD